MKVWACGILLLNFLSGQSMAYDTKQIYGYVEKATLVDKNLTLSAKLDTGALSASLSAIDIVKFEKNGLPYLRFKVPCKDGDISFEAEYVGKVNIKVRAGERQALGGLLKSQPIQRSVVMMHIRIGDKERAIPVNLANRKRFIYPILLGREAIKIFNGVVDPSVTFTAKPATVVKP